MIWTRPLSVANFSNAQSSPRHRSPRFARIRLGSLSQHDIACRGNMGSDASSGELLVAGQLQASQPGQTTSSPTTLSGYPLVVSCEDACHLAYRDGWPVVHTRLTIKVVAYISPLRSDIYAASRSYQRLNAEIAHHTLSFPEGTTLRERSPTGSMKYEVSFVSRPARAV